MYYIEDGATVRPVEMEEWSQMMATGTRTKVQNRVKGYLISTVFLGLDHGFGGEVQLYETMIFAGDSWTDRYMERYATKAEALAGHARIVEMVKLGKLPLDASKND